VGIEERERIEKRKGKRKEKGDGEVAPLFFKFMDPSPSTLQAITRSDYESKCDQTQHTARETGRLADTLPVYTKNL